MSAHDLLMDAACLVAAVVALGGMVGAQELEFDGFPFQIPYDGPSEGTAPALLAPLEAPAGAGGFVQVEGDRFVLSESGREVRFWGTNLSIGGCFPPHEVADRMARRMAALGINCVRMHFIDAAGFPRGIWEAEGWQNFPHTSFHPDALDRLDYLIARLKEHGVYTNINLHVARAWGPEDGFPAVGEGESLPRLGKGVSLFYPRCIEEQKRYARMLMRHVNAYTGNAYAEEPAVAMVEITNENGLLSAYFGSGGSLDDLPRPYLHELTRQWNEWLRRRYASAEELRAAWSEGEIVGGEENVLEAPASSPRLQVAGQAEAELTETRGPGGETVRTVTVQRPSDQGWHVQVLWPAIGIREGTVYELKMRLRANRRETVVLSCGRNHEPWGSLGLWQQVPVGPEWREHVIYFTGTDTDLPDAEGGGGGRISLTDLPKEGFQIALTDASLRRAAVYGLPTDEAPGRVSWVPKREWFRRTVPCRLDVLRFMREREADYYEEMVACLHDELGVRMPVTGTAVGSTPPHLAAETVDFLDSHNYWQHPVFPGRPWDRNNWFVRNVPMVNDPAGSTIAGLAAKRVFGLPFTVSEYNHPAPNDYRAEGFPLLALWGARQDWNGLFTYTYAHQDWESDQVKTFFDIKADPVRLAEQPACSHLLRGGGLGPAARQAAVEMTLQERLRYMTEGRPWRFTPNAFAAGADRLAWQDALLGFGAPGLRREERPAAPAGVRWQVGPDGRGLVTYVGRDCAGLIGFAAGQTLEAAGVRLSPGPTSLDGFSVVTLSAVEGQSLGEAGRYLLAAVSRCENRGMGWNAERNSVATDWGEGPTLCEGVPLSLTVRGAARVHALGPDGERRSRVEPRREGDGLEFALGPGYRTLWYELVIGD
jgi:hypothetical protein